MSEDNPQQRLAYDRTLLANERTFAAWLRTGLSISGAGLAVAKFFQDNPRPWLPIVLGALFVLAGVGFVLFGAGRYAKVSRDMSESGTPGTPAARGAIYSLALLVAFLLLAALTLIFPI